MGALGWIRYCGREADPCGMTTRNASYQTRQELVGVMGEPALQLKAAAKPGWLTMAPLARKWSGECGSWRTWVRTVSGRAFSHQFWAKAM